MWNIARKHAVHAHLHARVDFAELGKSREQGVDRAFIYAKRKFTTFQALQFHQTFLDLVAQIQQALRVVLEQSAGVGHAYRPGTANEQRLAERIFQLANSQTDRWLRAIEAFSRS